MFKLESSYQPSGDQPKAIAEIQQAFSLGKKKVTLLGATGTGKTFTMANIIQDIGKPTLVISHNKTLAANLPQNSNTFFPTTLSIISYLILIIINQKVISPLKDSISRKKLPSIKKLKCTD
jgi:excinuclease UvrABC helicase subunit UvrB